MDRIVCVYVLRKARLKVKLIFEKLLTMADEERRCLPPCQRQLSDEDLHAFCFECLGEEHAIHGLEGECEHCNLLSIKVLRLRLAFFKSLWGWRVDLAEARETDSPLSLALSPDHEALASVSQARFGVSSERADETSSFASGEVESALLS